MSNVYAVILAGGSGTRFWPASRRKNPKQLLPLGPGSDVLLAQTLQRFDKLCPPERVLIATGLHVLEATQAALPSLPNSAFLAEPVAKNTAPCIGWASMLIARKDPDAIVIVVPSDQYIADEPAYHAALSQAIASAATGVITTLGIEPTRPETGYGYIQSESEPVADLSGARRVRRFVEKPNLTRAEEYLAAGNYFWNAGMFVFRAQTMLDEMKTHMPALYAGLERMGDAHGKPNEAAVVAEVFDQVDKVSIDYGIMEKVKQLNVIPADIGWSDLGSFQVAWELSPKDGAGNVAPEHAILIDAEGNLVMDLRTPSNKSQAIAVVGLKDMCVIQTDDALLVIPRERCQDVRDVVDALRAAGKTELL